ncbi:MAG: NAD(P)-dependent dehydrogenase (short-subunit alcohol dehydrogenase family) [Gammaproteobacteria bacterium]|jgi:NAD(P)-dependent dehydrogenase (short-subunit alcohol dehydrogenase family)
MSKRKFDPGAAVIHGASRGIGLAFALVEDHRYDRIIATCRCPASADALRRLADEHNQRIDVIRMDVTDEASVAAAAMQIEKKVQCVSMMLCCAGVLHTDSFGPERRLDDINPSTMHAVFAVNAFGPLLIAKHFSQLFDRRARAVLVNLSARVGSIDDNRLGGWYSYRASKAALNMVTRNLSIELRRKHQGIICVAMHPGTVDTKLSRPFQRSAPKQKIFTADQAVAFLLEVIDGLGPDHNGRFYAWDGSEITW